MKYMYATGLHTFSRISARHYVEAWRYVRQDLPITKEESKGSFFVEREYTMIKLDNAHR